MPVCHTAAAITSGLCETVLIMPDESGRSGVGRTRDVVAPTSLAGTPTPTLPHKQSEEGWGGGGPMGPPTLFTIPVRYMKTCGLTPEIGYSSGHLVGLGRAVYLYFVGDMTRAPVPSSAYKLFEAAITHRKQILCTYQGRLRGLCPIILGHSQGREKALTYQFGGQSSRGLPPGGQWRCLWLSEVSNIRLRNGPWHAGDSHNQPQGCVEIVDLDVNPASPYDPKRRL